MTPDLLDQLLTSLLACACECLNTYSDCGCPCRNFVSAGAPPQDQCCDGGQLAIWADRIYVHGNFPSEQGQVQVCMAPLAAEITLRLDRCFPTVKDNGEPPTADEISAASAAIYKDQYTLTRCLICNLSSKRKLQEAVFRGSRIIPPQGGCISIEFKFTIQLPDPLPT